MNTWIQIAYLISTALFIFSLKWMNDPQTARRGVIAGVAAMLVAVIGTLINPAMVASNYKWIALAIVIGYSHRRAAVLGAAYRCSAANRSVARLRRFGCRAGGCR